jgi:hypothetical protein
MRSTVEKPAPLPVSVEAHPKIIEHTRRKREIATALADKRAANARLVVRCEEAQEQSLNARAAAVRRGQAATADDSSALAAIDAELAQVTDEIRVLERAAGQHDLDGRTVRAEVREEMRQQISAEIGDALRRVSDALEPVEARSTETRRILDCFLALLEDEQLRVLFE